jgi:glycosylphosphatidylinositol transamidase (GPIT) subunit GPI8
VSGQHHVLAVLLAEHYRDGLVWSWRELALGEWRTLDLANTQHDNDYDIGVAIIDSFTHFVLGYLEGMNKTSQLNLQQLVGASNGLYLTPV